MSRFVARCCKASSRGRRHDDVGRSRRGRGAVPRRSQSSCREALWAKVEGENAPKLSADACSCVARAAECPRGRGGRRRARRMDATLISVPASRSSISPSGWSSRRGVPLLDVRVGDAQELPFPDETFDTVVAAWMLYHVRDDRRSPRRFVFSHRADGSSRHRLDEAHRRNCASCTALSCRVRETVQRGERRGDPSPPLPPRRTDTEVVAIVDHRETLEALTVALVPDPSAAGRDPAAVPRPAHDDLRGGEMIRAAELIQAEPILGYARGDVPDYQMAAFCMAVLRGLSAARDIRADGRSARLAARSSTSTPPVASATRRRLRLHRSAGAASRWETRVAAGSGHTGGTLDKLESIPGDPDDLTLDEFIARRFARSARRSSAKPATWFRRTSCCTASATSPRLSTSCR